jgi:hypothetical protein
MLTVKSQKVPHSLEIKYELPLPDSISAATALHLKAICLNDDPHLKLLTKSKKHGSSYV